MAPEPRITGKLSRIRSHSFYVKILTAFISLLVITVVPVLYYHHLENRRILLDLSRDLTSEVSRRVIDNAGAYFLTRAAAVEISSRFARMGTISCSNDDQVELYILGMLESFPHVSQFFLGDENGDSIQGWRLADGIIRTRSIKLDAGTTRHRYWDRDHTIVKTEEAGPVNYDPRFRPWYTGALEAGGSHWTDLYVPYTNGKPAITPSCPVIDREGRTTGVWGMNIEMDEMSRFLTSLKIGKTGVAFIINRKNEVVAYPHLSRIVTEDDGSLRPVLIDELGVAHVSAAFREHVRTGESNCVVESRGRRFVASFSNFPERFPLPWKIGLVVPEDDFVGGAMELIQKTLLICGLIFVLSIFIAVLIARSISRPITILAGETGKIRDFDLDGGIDIKSYIKEIQLITKAVASMKTGLQAFRRYVPAELVRQLIHTGEEARLGGHKKELTVFFSDIAGFTSIAERVGPEELMVHLSEYFDELTQIISAHKGTVDKYIGDAILAFWGAPVHDADHALNACNAALLCQEKISELNQKWESEGKSALVTRIGISTGDTVVGNVGSSERINYTVMGDTVNLASRLEGASKLYRTRIIVSGKTREAVSENFRFRFLGVIAVKGKSETAAIYELMGRKTESDAAEICELCSEFTAGVEAYLSLDWDRACRIFTALSRKFPSDEPTLFYLSRCRQMRDNPPEEDWDSVEYLEFK